MSTMTYMGNQRYHIQISSGVSLGDASTAITVQLRQEEGIQSQDNMLEEVRFRIREVVSGDPSNYPVSIGWHTRRFLLEDSLPGQTAPPTAAIPACQGTLNCTPGCDGFKELNFTNQTFFCQAGHSSPETSNHNPPAGTTCPGTLASAHCQLSTKIMAEGATNLTNMRHHGFRFHDVDKQSGVHTVCGCDVISDDVDGDILYVELEITGTAVPADRAGWDHDVHDYLVFYRNDAVSSRDLDVTGTGFPYYVVADVREGDFVGAACMADNIPPGFGIVIESYGDDDSHDTTGDVEYAEFRVNRIWYGNSDPTMATQVFTNPQGWNNVARFVIEEGTPND